MAMEKPAEAQTHFGNLVWVNTKMDALRESECLCMNCELFKPNTDGHCRIAAAGYALCRLTNISFAVTRCPAFIPKAP